MHGALNLRFTPPRPKVVIRGRSRKPGRRHPNGDLVHDKTDPKAVAAAMPHRKAVPAEVRHDPKAETRLGRYQLCGLITSWEYDAGRWYAGAVNRYRAVIGGQNPSPPSNTGALIGSKGQAFVDDDEARRRKSIYDNAFAAVIEPGQRSAKAVARVAVYDEACPNGLFGAMRLGLVAIAVHRGLMTKAQADALCSQIKRRID